MLGILFATHSLLGQWLQELATHKTVNSVGNRELQSALKLHLKMKIELNFTHTKFALQYFKVFPNRF